ncbi:hypothetical protein CK203_034508 [Vitis vinifera]|uniref:BED-type domain-containing protein n=1 Tax=Vitis vinifera TaxID=29760 RepID=A0A438IDU5_VITVI|nr:hypothetical protein CK203_034508 [Vitis vinifera]
MFNRFAMASGSAGGGRGRGGDGGGGSGTFGRDLVWKYSCSPLEGNRNETICNFCGLVMKSGGISQFKYHLAHRDPNNNTKKCLSVPPEVKEEIRETLHEKNKAKAKKTVDIEDIRDQLRDTMGARHTHVMDEDDDDDDDDEDEELYMYPANMDLDERDAYREAVRPSKATKWEQQQHENLVGSKRKIGESSRLCGAPIMRKSQRMGIEPPSPYEIKNKYLEMEYKDMEAYVNQQREKWKTYGCTIMVDLKKLFISDEWTLHKLSRTNIGRDIEKLMFDQPYWDRVKHVVSYFEPLYMVLRIMDLEVVPTMPFVYELMRGVGSDPDLIQAVHEVFAKLDPNAESIGQFGNELKLRDMEVENDRVAEKDYFDLLDISAEVEFGVDVERVLSKEVHSESFSKDTEDSFQGALNSHQEVDSTSIGQSSRPSAADTSASGYNGSRGGTNDGSDHAGGDIREHQQSQYPMSQFTYENDFTYCTQDEDHGSRRAGPGTQFSDSSNEANVYPSYVMGYGQPSSSTDEEYGMPSYLSTAHMSYQVPYQMQEGFDMNTWVNLEYLIHVEAVGRTQEIYTWHVKNFNQYYRGSMSWYQYCL